MAAYRASAHGKEVCRAAKRRYESRLLLARGFNPLLYRPTDPLKLYYRYCRDPWGWMHEGIGDGPSMEEIRVACAGILYSEWASCEVLHPTMVRL